MNKTTIIAINHDTEAGNEVGAVFGVTKDEYSTFVALAGTYAMQRAKENDDDFSWSECVMMALENIPAEIRGGVLATTAVFAIKKLVEDFNRDRAVDSFMKMLGGEDDKEDEEDK